MTLTGRIHETALCSTERIGEGSHVSAFALLDRDATVGRRCTIGQGASLGPDVVLEDDCSIRAGARLVANLHLAAGVTVGENTVLGGERRTTIGRGVSIGANANVRPGVGVGQGAVIEPGAVVADPVPAHAVVSGNPALIVGYVAGDSTTSPTPADLSIEPTVTGIRETRVPGAHLYPVTSATDLRGSLVAADFADLPFAPQRAFMVFGVSSEFIRGSHAHRQCEQFLVCVTGSIRCLIDNGTVRDEVSLDGPIHGLHMPPMVWGTQYKYTRDAMLLVLASHAYDADDYIRDYDEFQRLVKRAG